VTGVFSRDNVVAIALFGIIGVGVPLAIIFVDVEPEQHVTAVAPTIAPVVPGACVNASLALRPCGIPHFGEVFFVGQDAADAPPPSLDPARFWDWVRQACETAFATYVGVPPAQSAYDLRVSYPSVDQWSAGSRQVVCLAVNRDQSPLHATVKGAAK
jgi:hypothetical protein